MNKAVDHSSCGYRRRHRDRQDLTLISTTAVLPPAVTSPRASNQILFKPNQFRKLVSTFVKKMESEERKFKSAKKKRPGKSTLKVTNKTKKNIKVKHTTPRKGPAGRPDRKNITPKRESLQEILNTKVHSGSKSTRNRYKSSASERIAHSMSLTNRHKNGSCDAVWRKTHEYSGRRSQEPEECMRKGSRLGGIKKNQKVEENPFSVYFKRQHNFRN